MARVVWQARQPDASNVPAGLRQELIDIADSVLLATETPNRFGVGAVVRCERLARCMGDEAEAEWLSFERTGYPLTRGQTWLMATGRATPYDDKAGTFAPLHDLLPEAKRYAAAAQPRQENHWLDTARTVQRERQNRPEFQRASAIIQRVHATIVGMIHEYVLATRNELKFGALSSTVLRDFQRRVDLALTSIDPELPERLSVAAARLSDADRESISHAMSTCRRMIESMADALYPAHEGTVDLDGKACEVDQGKPKNRLLVFIQRIESKSRRSRLKATLIELWGKTSAGVHADVSADEARCLFVCTYALLGELALIWDGARPNGRPS